VTLQVVDRDDQYVLNLCTEYLARDSTDPRSQLQPIHFG
jgi:hypothetical protein